MKALITVLREFLASLRNQPVPHLPCAAGEIPTAEELSYKVY
jgi:hypothetical protein